MAFFVRGESKPSLAELLGAGIGRGLETGLSQQEALRQQLTLESKKQEMQLQRGNSIANALLKMSGIEPTSNSPVNEPVGTSDYSEISALSPDDLLKLEGIRANRQKVDIASQKMALQDTKKFRDEIREGATSAQRLKNSVKKQRAILERGLKTGPLTWDSLMFRVGLRGAASPQAQAFQANLVDYMEGMRQKFGVKKYLLYSLELELCNLLLYHQLHWINDEPLLTEHRIMDIFP